MFNGTSWVGNVALAALVAALLLVAGGFALAGEGRERFRESMTERFDADGDGELSHEERREMRKERRRKHLDADGDGSVSDEERELAQERRRARHGPN